ncbi:MAG: LysM peptidoglycan-binding domain-containing protein [Desulfuromonadales bacterium]|nr:LysM peptidoglycan-binding domain-containing protein [Desulfuromonadales bacterium]
MKSLFLLLLFLLGGCWPAIQPQVKHVAPAVEDISVVAVSEVAPVVVEIATEATEISDTDDGLLSTVETIAATEPVIEEPALPAPLPYYGDFPLSDHRRVDKLRKFYTGNGRKTLGRWLERAGRYVPGIQEIFAEEGVPLDLAYLAMIESGFNVRAYSWAHAAGPWQFIESTGKFYGLKNDWWRDDRCDIEKSTRAAARHLKYLYGRFDGDWYLAVAAYNAGGGKVRKAIKSSKSRDFWILTEGKILREETRNYLPKLLAALEIVRDLEAHGFTGLDFAEPVAYETVLIPTTTDLEIIAQFCNVSYDEIKALNPELKRWCTPPGEANFRLKIPAGTGAQLERLYAGLSPSQRASYHRHQVKRGDTLLALANKYRIQVADIVTLNKINNPRALQLGTNLILPLKEGFTRLPVDELADGYVRSKRRTYTVREGDSLWTIATRFGVTEKQLRVWNRLGWSNLIRPGQKLAVSKTGQRTVTKVARKTGPAKKVVYQVRPGDTLWGIGRQFEVETGMIRLWNHLSSGNILHPGQKLTLMVPTRRQG